MKRIKIRTPIWKSRSIGIAEYHFSFNNVIEVEITYKNKNGVKIYPDIYVLSWGKASQYPVQIVKGTQLRIVPINELKVA